jgi:hypothetical protein
MKYGRPFPLMIKGLHVNGGRSLQASSLWGGAFKSKEKKSLECFMIRMEVLFLSHMVYVFVTWSLPIWPIKPNFLMSHWNFCSRPLLHMLQFSRQTSSTFLKRVKALCFSHMVTSNLMHQIQFSVTRLDSIFKEPNWHRNKKSSNLNNMSSSFKLKS